MNYFVSSVFFNQVVVGEEDDEKELGWKKGNGSTYQIKIPALSYCYLDRRRF